MLAPVDVPGTFGLTGVSGNTIIGNYFDSSGEHGFMQTLPAASGAEPAPEPGSLTLVACGMLGLAVFTRRWRGKSGLAGAHKSGNVPPSAS